VSIVDDDIVSNPSDNPTFESVVSARLSRRSLFRTGAAAAGAAVALTGTDALMRSVPVHATGGNDRGYGGFGHPAGTPLVGFEGVPAGTDDAIVVAPGYTAQVLIAWGDPVSDGPAFAPDASNTAEEQAQQWGMHNDGLVYFPFRGSSKHGLLVQNHEYTDDGLLFPDGVANWTAEKTAKSLNAHGVSVIEVRRRRGQWEVVRPSEYARRITGQTPIAFAGPAAGHPMLMTSADPTGTTVLGTLNNCAMGYTPWGTYLACEENFNGYFRKTAAPNALEARYGISAAGFGYLWHTTDSRFQVDVETNEPNRFGWVTEINPFDPASTPVKRTALGRIKHEGAWVQEARDGRLVVYMGDDERNEYIYRYISNLPWRQALRQGTYPLDDGVLYVARFDANGTGEWLPLTPDNPALAGWTLADICIKTRQAADLAGATKMDRPEWIDTYPDQLMAIATLTNNSRRGTDTTPPLGDDPTRPPVDAANPRPNNVYGHIIRWGYDYDFTQPTFWWDIFALAGDRNNPAHGSTVNGDAYGSPDGLYVAPSGRLWIQTDVSTSTINAGAYAGFGNNQMLCADPVTRRTRRFLVGPSQCEVTGCFATPDERTMFVGIQHPGERPDDRPGDPANPGAFSSWPDGGGGRPRSALLVITKNDGGEIGS
jgi:secreted PhoX family phosphatase